MCAQENDGHREEIRNIWAPESFLEEGTGPENPMSRDRCEGLGTAGIRDHELSMPRKDQAPGVSRERASNTGPKKGF